MKIQIPEKLTGEQLFAAEINEVVVSVNTLYDQSINVDDFGALGDGITDDSISIQSAITSAGTNGVVYFTGGKEYLLKDSISCPIGVTLIGFGAVIKRGNKLTTTTTSAAVNNSTIINVADASQLKSGDKIILVDGTSPNSGQSIDETSANSSGTAPNEILSISANQITLVAGISLPANGNLNGSNEFPTSTVLVKVYNLFTCGNDTNITGLTFDGNRLNNDVNYAWVFNKTIFFTSDSSNTRVLNCTFLEIPNEAIFISHQSIISNNDAENLNGSFVHISASGNSGEGENLIINNRLRNICLETTLNNHNEGVVTYSNKAVKTSFIGNFVSGSARAVLGAMSASIDKDNELIFSGNQCYDCQSILQAASNNLGMLETILFTNNYFNNCGQMSIVGQFSTLKKGMGIDRVIITGNEFVDSSIVFIEASGLLISNNTFTFTPGFSPSWDYCILLDESANFNINGNRFEDKETSLSTITYCIVYNEKTTLSKIKTDISTTTDYLYSLRNSSINNNTILNFAKGIDQKDTASTSRDWIAIGFDIIGNKIQMKSDASSEWAIRCYPGFFVSNNYIYGDFNTTRGIYMHGVRSVNSANKNGCVVTNNYIVGISESVRVAAFNNGAESQNMVFINNFCSGIIKDYSAGNSIIAPNTQLKAEFMPVKLIREDSGWY